MNAQTANDPIERLCACTALRRAARSATQLYDLVLQPTGLKATQFIALKNIAEAGELEQWRFAKQQALAVETLSRRLAVLRKKGLVAARVGGNHGERIYSLTELGKETLAKATPHWERAQRRLTATLGAPELRLLLRLCDLTVDAAHEAEQMRASNAGALEPLPAKSNGNGMGTADQRPIAI
jgi:DNA-binding MarR family transcriptional regulator